MSNDFKTPFTIYQHNEFGYYTGKSKTTTKYLGIPFRWTSIPLPIIPEGKFAKLNGKQWDIVDEFYQPPEPIPQEVSARQARLALLQAGKLSDVDLAIDSLPEPDRSAAQIEWEYATVIQRNSPLVISLTPALNMTEEEMDALFLAAKDL